ncbi:hypothetical protein F4861DRAFT_41032 [Xylaria intraflava]|nr:hypothetical protein F4861DRAFT_41032 [Xylaria intraflava]
MSAPGITYSGALATRGVDEDEEPCVFQGFKFWLSVRVPHRQTYSDTIEENGGTVVTKEKSADILICDPAKDPAPGSYSYQLIEDAVKGGSLETKGNYLCDLPAFQSDRSRPAPRAKLTRNKFVAEDDKLLMKFVTKMERLGEPISGNEIYMEFSKQHPHHTWRSWRDRWVKKLRSLPRPPVSDGESSPQPKDTAVSSSRRANTDKGHVTKSRARFTAEEDEFLLETIHHAIENREPWNGYEPYKRLASEFPQRTYTSWRERALNHVAKQNMDQILQWEREADFHPGDGEDATTDNIKDQQTRSKENEDNANLPNALLQQGNKSTKARSVEKELEEVTTHENNNQREHQGTTPSPVRRVRSPERSPSGQRLVERNASGYPARSIANTSPVPGLGESITTKEQFYRDYNTFLESLGVMDRQIPSIGGTAIALWDLWQSVRSKVAVGLDWQEIAEDLGFDWVSMESVPKELQQCYEEYLKPFAEAMMDFNDSSDGSDGNLSEDDADRESARPLPSSPPVLPSLKRPFAAMKPMYERALPQFTPKRRRIDRNHEVPSTPDDVNGTSHLRHPRNSDKISPTTPTVKHRGAVLIPETQSSLRNEGGESGDEVDDLPILPRRRKRRLEPETQDFNFVSDTQIYTDDEAPNHSDNDSQIAMTPSRQLILESDAMSAKTQRHASVLAVSRQEMVQASPTAPRRTRIPLRQDSADDDAEPREISGRTRRAPVPTQQAQPKRRTLPASFESKAAGTTFAGAETRQRPSLIEETPDDIIDHFISLGYTRDTVLCSLRATSWIIGNAGQVMEMLQRGEPLPPRTTGVWTQRDDESLKLVYADNPPPNAKEEKKRAKAKRRLQAKHGAEQIALRKRYLLDEQPM